VRRQTDAAVGTDDPADPAEEHPQVVVHLGDRADGAAPAAGGVALLDGDGGADAVDPVDVGLGHPLEELAGVGGKRLDVAALALGVQGVEDQRRLPRARDAGNGRQAAAGDVDVAALEVVLASATDTDQVGQRDSSERRYPLPEGDPTRYQHFAWK